jgi:formylmethanofuran dehydrogenase subunit B
MSVHPSPEPSASPVWTCPYCPLLCDDLHPGAGAGIAAADCAIAHQRLAQVLAPADATPRVHGQPATLDQALAAAAEVLSASRQPLFAGLGTDVAGARALVPLALATGAICDAAGGAALAQALRAQQDRGGFTATLAELHERAEHIVFVGSWAPERAPRLLQRIAAGRTPAPTLLSLGATPGYSGGLPVAELPLQGDLLQTLASLAALLSGRTLRQPAPGLGALAQQLKDSRYAVLVWEPAQLGPHAALAIERLQQIVGLLNRKTRAAGFPVGGAEGASTANQVFAWMTGLPLRTRLGATGFSHDPQTLDTTKLLASGSVDALLWVCAFGGAAPPEAALPRIVLAPAFMGNRLGDESRTIFIPVATPGVGHGGHLFRTDGVVLLPLHACAAQALPSVAEVVRRLAALSTGGLHSLHGEGVAA